MNQAQYTPLIKYGMNVVGKSLGYIERGDFKGLKNRIYKKISAKFGINLDEEESKRSLRSILEGAAESLDNSEIAWWRKEHAARIFEKLGLTERAEKARKELKELEKSYHKFLSTYQEENNFNTFY